MQNRFAEDGPERRGQVKCAEAQFKQDIEKHIEDISDGYLIRDFTSD
jgi:hypothetical protein